ncbi:TOM (translocase of outer membrane) complex component, partial [Dimargaris xerosporica]
REELATSLKTKGNKYYAGRNYRKAIALYTQALKFKEDPVYYANRAACHNELGDHTKTIDDCNSAIKLNPTYVKALARRASAYEKMDEYRAALDDFTTACILDKFKNQSWAMAAERMARRYAEGEAKKIFANRTPRLPSRSFINAFLSSYRPDPALVSPPENLSECTVGEQAFWKAVVSLNDHQYAQALTSINEAIDNGCGAWEAKALNIRGTFAFLMGDNDKALRDLNRSIELNPNDPQAYLKKANTLTDCQRIAETVQAIDAASNIANVDQTEVHYQKGQVFFLSNEFMHAIDEFSRAIESDPTFVYPYIQKAVCQYKNGDITGSDATFKDAIARFPQSSDIYNHYGEVLVDRQMFDEGAQAFDKAIEVDSMQPMAALNKAILVLQWKQDPTAAMDLVDLALKRDPECEMANATASQICIHAMRFDEALHYLNKAVESGKSENEIMQAVLLRETTRAQLEAIKDNPDTMAQMFTAASGM